MPDSNCPFCDTTVDKLALQCDMFNYWVHYSCTNLPPYVIIQLSKSTSLFSCLTCVHERFKNDFPELHTQIEGAIKSQNDALHLPIVSEIAVTLIEAAPPIHTHSSNFNTHSCNLTTHTHFGNILSNSYHFSPTSSASSRIPTHPTFYKPSSTETSPANKPVDNYSPTLICAPCRSNTYL